MIHSHNHHHCHQQQNISVKLLYVCLFINIVFVIIEATIGWKSNSTGLLSDAGHNLSDTLGLLLSLIAIYLERSKNNSNKMISKYISLTNGLLLLIAVAIILIESIEKIINPQSVNSQAVIFTSLAAIIINGLTAYLLMKGNRKDINIRAAYLHAASDMLVSVGVVLSGIAISITGFNIIDPIVSLVISAFIAIPTIRLVRDTIKSMK